MQKNDSAKEIFEEIKYSKNILMSLHEGPDGDNLASSTAMKYFLEKYLHKKVELISKDEIGEDFMIFPFSKEVRFGVDFSDANLDEFDFLFTLTETEDFIKGSFRSRKRVDISLFAKELNGGGHKFAAAFRLPKMSLRKAEEKVFEVIKNVGIHIVSG